MAAEATTQISHVQAIEHKLARRTQTAFLVLFIIGSGILIFRGHVYSKWILLTAFFFSLPLPVYLIIRWLNKLAPRFSDSDTPWSHFIYTVLTIAIYVAVLVLLFNANEWYRQYLLSHDVVNVPAIITGEKIVGNKRMAGKVELFDYAVNGEVWQGKISSALTHKRPGDSLNLSVSTWDNGVYKVKD